jgi:hypothetical protein
MHSRAKGAWVLLLTGVFAVACPSQTRMPAADQEGVQETLKHRSRQLAVSMYWGPFFRDARYLLISDQPPGDVDLLRGPRGERIHPGEAVGILPAGTTVRIVDVQFPTATATTTRSLITPRFFTWVLVEVPDADRLRVLVLRDDPTTRDAFLDLLARYLTTDDVAARLATFPEPLRAAIAEKRLIADMDVESVRMAWGHPIRVDRAFEEGVRLDTWTYEGGRTLTLRNGRLVHWEEPGDDT